VIKNKPHAKKFLGAAVAGPVFREVSDKLMSAETGSFPLAQERLMKLDSVQYFYAGSKKDIRQVADFLQLHYQDSTGNVEWARWYGSIDQSVLNEKKIQKSLVPDVKGMGLKDALYILENMHMKVIAKGVGKVKSQSLQPGSPYSKNEMLTLELD
jgi:cell division protein FtsI (penicillin-binding protein 3)